jgi:hypothetical protein
MFSKLPFDPADVALVGINLPHLECASQAKTACPPEAFISLTLL